MKDTLLLSKRDMQSAPSKAKPRRAWKTIQALDDKFKIISASRLYERYDINELTKMISSLKKSNIPEAVIDLFVFSFLITWANPDPASAQIKGLASARSEQADAYWLGYKSR